METLQTEWAVESVLGLQRLDLRGDLSQRVPRGRVLEVLPNSMDLDARLLRECPDVPSEVSSFYAEQWLAFQHSKGNTNGSRATFKELCAVLLPRDVSWEDALYFAMRGICTRNLITLSYFTMAAAHLLMDIASEVIPTQKTRSRTYLECRAEILERLESDLVDKLRVRKVVKRDDGRGADESLPRIIANRIFNAFTDLGIVLEFLNIDSAGSLQVSADCANAEFLMNRLFGIPTRIPGFDMLFGGGGLMLTDSPRFKSDANSPLPNHAKMIGGRSVLRIGLPGSGKTLLSLEFAIEVARKGGVVWVISFEQTEEECLYGLESIGVSTSLLPSQSDAESRYSRRRLLPSRIGRRHKEHWCFCVRPTNRSVIGIF